MVPWPYGPMASQRTRKEGLRRWPFAGRLLLDGGGDALALLDTTRRVALPTRLAELRDLEARFQGPNSPAPAATVRQMADMVEKMGPQLQKALGELCAAAGRAPPGDDPQQEERAQALREEALEEMRYSREKQAVQRLWLWHPFDGPDGLTALHVAALLDSPALVRVLVPAPDASDLFGLHAPMAAPLLTCSRRAAARPLADLFAACEDLRLVSKARVALCKGATPLAVTVLCHHAAAVEALLEAGADVHATLPPWNAPATGGAAWTLLDLCLRDPLVGVREEALGDGDMPRILAALLDAGDDPLAPRRLSKDGGDRGEATCPLLEAARGREGRRSPLVAPMLAHVLRMREEGRLDGGAILRGAHAALLVGEADTALRLLDGWEEERALPADWLPLLRAACDAGQLEVVQALLQPPTRAKAKAMRESGTSTQRAPHIAVFAAARGRAPELRALHDAGAVLTLPLRRLALLLAIDLGCQAGVELALGWSEAQGCAAAEPAAAAAALVAFCEGDALAAPPSKGEQELVLSAARNKVEFADCYYPKDARSPDPRCPLLRVCFAASSKFPARPLCPDEKCRHGRPGTAAVGLLDALRAAGFQPRQPTDPHWHSEWHGPGHILSTPAIGLAYERPAWSPECHARFPARFREAARALLLAARSGAAPAAGGGRRGRRPCGLQDLPCEVLQGIIGFAAYPVSAWL